MSRRNLSSFVLLALVFLTRLNLSGQEAQPASGKVSIPLEIPAGTPLRVYLTRRVWYRPGQIVQAKTAEPVWAFDRVILPAGTALEGSIVELKPVTKTARTMSIIRGDFTALKHAQVAFTSITLPSGRLPLVTEPSLGLASIYVPPRPGKNQKQPSTSSAKSARLTRFLKQQAEAQANARSQGFLQLVRGPNKREWLEDYAWSRLPYHPEYYRSGTRFDAVLSSPLDLGHAEIATKTLQDIGSLAVPNGQALVRFLSTIDSADAKSGDPVLGVLSQPLFSADHHLALPEGTKLAGKVTLARPAKMFHRGGQLRFIFTKVELPAFLPASAPRVETTQTQLTAAESQAGPVTVDSEGTAKSTESKTRFLRPIIAGLVAAKSMDNDAGKQDASGGASANYSGRSLGGFSGFGLFGTAASLGPSYVGTALGFYGLAWSVYSTVISRGREVTFQKNNAVSIRFAPLPVGRQNVP